MVTTKVATRMAQYGRLKEFNADSEPITAYLERVELFFEANKVADGKRVPILVTSELKCMGGFEA